MAPPAPAPAAAQAAAPRPPAAPPQAPAFNLPGVAAPAPASRSSTPAFGVPHASAPGLPVMPPRPQAASASQPNLPVAKAPAPLDLSLEEDSFPVDLEESEPAAPPPVAVAAVRSPAPAPAAPKLMGTASKETEIHARPASLWRRLLALAIDTGAIAGVAALYLMLASSVAGVQAPQTSVSGIDGLVVQIRALQSVLLPGLALLLVLSLVYCAVSAFLWNGRTLGRRLLGLRLVDTHGLAPAPGRAIVRAMLASLSFGLFLAGFWMALFDRRGQTLHDKLTSTYVVQPS
ncbi:putative RDD family membrane protein YckC [Archangium gephyra]|nr:putative RDD family membrane protein YckC [Archangium gephyra]